MSMSKSGVNASFTYDIDGYRTSKTVNGVTTTYYLDGDRISALKKGADELMFIYDEKGLAIGFYYNGVPYVYAKNLQGDVTGIGAASGALIGTGFGMVAGAALAGSITASTSSVMAGGSALVTTVSTGGVSAGAVCVSNNIQKAGTEIANVATNVTQKVATNIPANPGKPFVSGKTGLQAGVNPNTLTPTKDLSTLSSRRMFSAVKYGGDKAVIVGRTGIIYDGHHRVAAAIKSGRAIDVFVTPYK